MNERKYWQYGDDSHTSDKSTIFICLRTSDEIIFILSSKRGTCSLFDQLRGYAKGTFIFGYQILLTALTLRTHTLMRFYAPAITARALSRLCQGYKRDMQSSHEYVLVRYTYRAHHTFAGYRTLMHNVLRDDGKYGYITRQRPMLFSLVPHWLMLIRNQRSHKRTKMTTDVH